MTVDGPLMSSPGSTSVIWLLGTPAPKPSVMDPVTLANARVVAEACGMATLEPAINARIRLAQASKTNRRRMILPMVPSLFLTHSADSSREPYKVRAINTKNDFKTEIVTVI
jgi:hypothetical protein